MKRFSGPVKSSEALCIPCCPPMPSEVHGFRINSLFYFRPDEHHENWSLPKSATGLNVTACRSAMCRAKNVVVSGGLLRLLSEQDENDKTRCTKLGEAWKYRLCFRESWVKEICWDGSRSYKHLLLIQRFKIDHLVFFLIKFQSWCPDLTSETSMDLFTVAPLF